MSEKSFNKKGFRKPPLSEKEKEVLAESFINSLPAVDRTKQEVENIVIKDRVIKKEKIKNLTLRIPEGVHLDMLELSSMTGLSINAVCIQLLRPLLKEKLKELKEEN